jgi:hypothetical protein
MLLLLTPQVLPLLASLFMLLLTPRPISRKISRPLSRKIKPPWLHQLSKIEKRLSCWVVIFRSLFCDSTV